MEVVVIVAVVLVAAAAAVVVVVVVVLVVVVVVGPSIRSKLDLVSAGGNSLCLVYVHITT